ncbi:hypothetical protein JWG42_14705 [Desulfoprunum benzoelyticum]|uniref:Uncharacterized protein n=1 Tax=Desulfoprunum benzoelyticum TaxID=1506996 RepID=A0A840UTH3_9BACT|nr:hypothetical protein [Desulfoprunum benzoelyticum]MBB5348053.1 hypothetical protein [Desulfoprunum benzoelyticum]MBM9531407.1 hypothetical protein [Desulfoprunum benzoelyticum]
MTTLKDIKDKELIEKGTKILFKELGYADTIRFLTIPRDIREESVKRHRKWQKGLDKETFFNEVFRNQN